MVMVVTTMSGVGLVIVVVLVVPGVSVVVVVQHAHARELPGHSRSVGTWLHSRCSVRTWRHSCCRVGIWTEGDSIAQMTARSRAKKMATRRTRAGVTTRKTSTMNRITESCLSNIVEEDMMLVYKVELALREVKEEVV